MPQVVWRSALLGLGRCGSDCTQNNKIWCSSVTFRSLWLYLVSLWGFGSKSTSLHCFFFVFFPSPTHPFHVTGVTFGWFWVWGIWLLALLLFFVCTFTSNTASGAAVVMQKAAELHINSAGPILFQDVNVFGLKRVALWQFHKTIQLGFA